MGQYDFVSGGAAANDAINQFIDKQKTLQRQTMLDALNQQQVEAQIANQQAQTSMQAEQQRSMAEQRQAALEKSVLDNYKAQPGADLSSVDPSVLQTLQKYGRVNESQPDLTPISGAPGSVMPSGPKKLSYAGSPEDQDAIMRKTALKDYLAQHGDTMTPEEKQFINYELAVDDFKNGPPTYPSGAFSKNEPMWVLDDQTGKVTQVLGADGQPQMVPGGHYFTRTRPPNPPQPNASNSPQLIQQGGKSYWAVPGTTPDKWIAIAGGPVREGNEPSTTTKAWEIPQSAVNQINAMTRAKGKESQGWFSSASPEVVQSVWNAKQQVINKLDPDLQAWVMDIINAPYYATEHPELTSEQIIQQGFKPDEFSQLTQGDIAHLRQVLDIVMEKNNAPKP